MSTNAIEVFTFPVTNAPVSTYIDEKGDPWFVGSDVLKVLYGKSDGQGHRYDKLNQDERCIVPRKHLGLPGGKPMTLITESGLYKLIMRSDLPIARSFQDWVTGTVLPAIRKRGGYVLGQEKLVTGEMTKKEFMARALIMAQETLEDLTAERDALLAEKQILAPKAKLYDQFMDVDGTLNLTSAAKVLGFTSGRALGMYLRETLNWLFLDTKQVIPKAHVIEKGFMTTKAWSMIDRQKSGVQGRITAKGGD